MWYKTAGLMEFYIFIMFREKLGNRVLIKTAGDELSPKVRILHFNAEHFRLHVVL